MKPRLGETGRFPEGKMHPGDEGELKFAVAKDSQGNVHLNFGKDVSWLAFPPSTAIELAKLLLKNAGVTKVELSF
jgi:hypothetical protein